MTWSNIPEELHAAASLAAVEPSGQLVHPSINHDADSDARAVWRQKKLGHGDTVNLHHRAPIADAQEREPSVDVEHDGAHHVNMHLLDLRLLGPSARWPKRERTFPRRSRVFAQVPTQSYKEERQVQDRLYA